MKVWAAVLLLHLLMICTGQISYHIAVIINDIAWTIAAALAAISSIRAAASVHGCERAAWLLFAAGAIAWAAGQIIWNVYEIYLGVRAPFPSYADMAYLAFSLLMIAGLFVLRATQGERRLTCLRAANLALLLCSLASVLITSFAQPIGEIRRPFDAAAILVTENASIALAFIIAVYFLWSYRWGDRLLPYGLITLSLGVHMITGLLYTRELIAAEYGATSFFNAGWLLAFALHQWAAEAQVSNKVSGQASSLSLQQSQGWVEAIVPSFLLLCVAISAIALAEEATPTTIYLRSSVLVAFAAILASREAWLYWRKQQLREALDISEQTLARARERLQELDAERSDLERVIETTARAGRVGLWEWNVATNVVRFSPEYKRHLGYTEHELNDDFEEWQSRLHPQDYPRVMRELESFLRDPHREFVSEQRLRHRDGSYRWMLVQGTMSFDTAGRPVRMMGSLVDITQFKQLEQSLRESEGRYRDLADALESRVMQRTRELSNAYRESQNFAYAVAHDLKAPLRAINGFCAMLEQSAGDRLTHAERSYVERAREGAIRMAGLIDDLLDYSRVEHREQRLGPIDCREFVHELLESMTERIAESRAEISVDLDDTPVLADSEGLRIVLRNLLDNALKFSRAADQPRIVINSHVDGGRYILTVRDNGIGFEPAYGERIFDIFNRLHASGYEGTGIGLALVRKAVQRMGGEVWAESTPGRGATFYVSLEVASEKDGPIDEERTSFDAAPQK
ncbi:MAG TPA: ATP-binding protein [Steroidobacter sp.]|uniref:sensor histidine kinase n=1 Tax=Steroidobacter sp. TaxID=1978227 RepID=UPI002EDA0242